MRSLIPGIDPGGTRVGQPFKAALLIKKVSLTIQVFDVATEDFHALEVFLRLSQEEGGDPGLLLPVSEFMISSDGTTNPDASPQISDYSDIIAGTVWAPLYVGLEVVERGAVVSYALKVHLDYEEISVPWLDWFLMWDFLDNVPNNSEEY